jgi:hypothetical protein
MREKENSDNDRDMQDKFENLCQENSDQINSEIASAIGEGIEEGLKKGLEEGIKKGILCGLEDCLDLGFLKLEDIHTKNMEEIAEEVASEFIRNKVKDCVKRDTCPVLKDRADRFCNQIIDEIKEEPAEVVEDQINLIRTLPVKEICKREEEKIRQKVREKISHNFISVTLFDGILDAITECMDEGVKNCTRKIHDEMAQDEQVQDEPFL